MWCTLTQFLTIRYHQIPGRGNLWGARKNPNVQQTTPPLRNGAFGLSKGKKYSHRNVTIQSCSDDERVAYMPSNNSEVETLCVNMLPE